MGHGSGKDRRRETGWTGLLAAGLGPALAGGLGEAIWATVKTAWLGRLSFVSGEVLWMAPVSALIWAGAPAVLAGLAVARLRDRERGTRTALAVSIGLALFGVMTTVRAIHWGASALVAAGVACRVHAKWGRELVRGFRRITPAIAVLVLVVFGLGRPGDAAAPPTPHLDGAPNVLLIILDTVRAWNLGVYGYDRPTTPALDRLARESVVYDVAISPSSWTLPSHASAFTGYPPSRLTANWRSSLRDRRWTLAEELLARGYRTAGFVANVEYCSLETGLGQGFQHYEDYERSLVRVLVTSRLGLFAFGKAAALARGPLDTVVERIWLADRKLAEEVVDTSLGWIRESDSERPFFAFLNLYDAHAPYQPPRLDRYLERVEVATGAAPYGASDSLIARYDAGIAYMDAELQRLLDELDDAGRLENTLVIVTSDHGEEFLEHDLLGHGDSLYWPSIHIPMIVRLPGGRGGGVRIDGPASLTALPSLVMAVVAPGEPSPFPGSPLRLDPASDAPPTPAFSEVRFAPNRPDHHPISRGDMHSLVAHGLHYIRNGDGSEEVYAHRTDRLERTNLAHDLARARLAWFREVLDGILEPGSMSENR